MCLDLRNYRSVSDLSFLSRVIEKMVLRQLFTYLNSLCPSLSAYRPCHSTETALPKMNNDILFALDGDDVSVLPLIDLSSAFDTIDHHIPFHRLQSLYGISVTVLSWFESYLTGRTQTVTVNDRSWRHSDVFFAVPQGSVLGPVFFILNSTSLCSLTEIHQPVFLPMTHSYFSFDLLIRYTPLSWQCRHSSLTWRPGWHKTNWNCMTTRQRLSLWSQIEPFFLMISPHLFVLAQPTFRSRPVLITLVSRFQITSLLTSTFFICQLFWLRGNQIYPPAPSWLLKQPQLSSVPLF